MHSIKLRVTDKSYTFVLQVARWPFIVLITPDCDYCECLTDYFKTFLLQSMQAFMYFIFIIRKSSYYI